MPMFPETWMDELLQKTDLVSLVSEYVPLSQKSGRLWGCCPFHIEKTPSFSVQPDKQMYYCFGCHAGGGAIQFAREIERLSFVDAVKFLAQRAGMELPDEVDDDRLRRERAHKERLYAACKEAALFYHRQLLSPGGKQAQAYLAKRGVDGKLATRFGLGFALETWDGLTNYLTGKGYTNDELIDAGLAIRGKRKNGCYDAYRNRVIFPIIATSGRVIGFGARTMKKDEQPKYINTGDTPIYNKRSNLYALNMQKGKHPVDLVMVEGYMDVISLHACGIDNAVASLGTALTQQQARLMKRYVERVYISYDGDAAGQNATLRGLDILAAEGLEVKVISIPGNMDPDDYVRRNGKAAFLKLKDDANTLNGFRLSHLATQFDLLTADGREGYAKRACAFVGGLEPVERERYIPVIARNAGVSLDAVEAQCGLVKPVETNNTAKNRNTRNKIREAKVTEPNRIEQTLLACMQASRENTTYAAERMAEAGVTFSQEGFAGYADALLVAYSTSETPDMARLLAELPEQQAEAAAMAMTADPLEGEAASVIDDCVEKLRYKQINVRLKELADKMSAGEGDRTVLLREHAELMKKLKEFK